MRKTIKILDEMEISRSSKQRELKKERLFENIKKKVSLFLEYFISTVLTGTQYDRHQTHACIVAIYVQN